MYRLLVAIGVLTPPHSRAAMAACRATHPGWRVVETKTLARERGRYVVAVFYEEPPLISFPMQYQLYAVGRDLQAVEELPTEPESPYWIRGRK